MRKLVALVPFAALLLGACGSAPAAPPFKAVADNKLLMQSVIDPVGGDIYDACSNCHQQYMDAIVNANK